MATHVETEDIDSTTPSLPLSSLPLSSLPLSSLPLQSTDNTLPEGPSSLPSSLPPGVACIKPQYITQKRPLQKDDSEDQTTPTASGTPPPKKRKVRGQNKHRPSIKLNFCDQLCPSLHSSSSSSDCSYKDKCRYSHNIKEFLQVKPTDISDKCYMFVTFGYCPSGVACRYGAGHISMEECSNVINETVYDRDRVTIRNVLTKTLQIELRKKKIKFVRSESYLKEGVAGIEGGVASIEGGVASIEGVASTEEGVANAEGVASTEGGVASTDGGVASTEGGVASIEGVASIKGVATTEGGVANIEGVANAEGVASTEGGVASTDGGVASTEGGVASIEGVANIEGVASTDGGVANIEGVASTEGGVVSFKEGSKVFGSFTDEENIKLRQLEKKKIDFKNKLYLAPLTTVGNLPFRRVCKKYGVDITCGEMALAVKLLQGQQSEWALMKRHESEDIFGVQVCGSFQDSMTKCAELISTNCNVDFIDLNVGCPLDMVYKKGGGCGLMQRKGRFEQIVRGMTQVIDCPLTVKMRTGVYDKNWNAHKLAPCIREWGASLLSIHGRSREQRYTHLADWSYINKCAELADPMPVFGNGDILSFEDYLSAIENNKIAGVMIARGALIKPWIFTEIKEQRHWDISSSERFEILRDYTNYGLENWGSDTLGVERTRRFLLEWLSFLHRYIPVGLLERLPQKINERPPCFIGRDDLETMMASRNCQDWIKLSEMLLGPVPSNFSFLPKHKANSYSTEG